MGTSILKVCICVPGFCPKVLSVCAKAYQTWQVFKLKLTEGTTNSLSRGRCSTWLSSLLLWTSLYSSLLVWWTMATSIVFGYSEYPSALLVRALW